jgi:hypothetical protein
MAAHMHRKQTRPQHIHFDEKDEKEPSMELTPNLEEELTPDWDAVERDVMLKLQYLRAIWEYTASANPEAHKRMKRDLYMPAVKCLAAFCSAIQEEQE